MMDSERIIQVLGAVIRERRVALRMSQEDFAEHVGLHRTYIGAIERGERNLSLRNLLRVAFGLGLRTSELLAVTERELELDG